MLHRCQALAYLTALLVAACALYSTRVKLYGARDEAQSPYAFPKDCSIAVLRGRRIQACRLSFMTSTDQS